MTTVPYDRDKLIRQAVDLLATGGGNGAQEAERRATIGRYLDAVVRSLRKTRDRARREPSPLQVNEQLVALAETLEAAAKRMKRLSPPARRRLNAFWLPATPSNASGRQTFATAFAAGLRSSIVESDLELMAQAARDAAAVEPPKPGRRADSLKEETVTSARALFIHFRKRLPSTHYKGDFVDLCQLLWELAFDELAPDFRWHIRAVLSSALSDR